MKKVVAILGFIAIAGYATPDASWAHRHILGPPEGERRPLIPAEHDEFVGPILRGEGLLQRAEQPSWNWLNLTHTDPYHTLGGEPYHPAFSRHFYAPDGAALMFSLPFLNLPSFQTSPQGTSGNMKINGDPYIK